MPSVSVIIPVYNSERYLHRCIDSVLAQTFTDFELILVDDGSTDFSGKICDEYADNNSHVRVYHKNNEGAASARNYGLKKSTGEFVTFIDSDDWISIKCLENMINPIRKYNADLCVGRDVRVDSENEAPPDDCIIESIESVEKGANALNKVARENGDRYRCCHAKLVKRTIADNIYFPIERRWSEDTAVIYLWYHHSKTVVFLEYSPYFYYSNPDSVTRTKDITIEFDEIETWHEQLRLYSKSYRELFYYSLDVYKNTLIRWLLFLDKDEQYLKEKKRIQKELRNVLRTLGIHEPSYVQNNIWIYEMAFPHVARTVWLTIGIRNRIKRSLYIHGKK